MLLRRFDRDREELLHDQLSQERGLLRLPQPGAEWHGVRELSYPIYNSATGFTCSSDAVFPVVQAPNGNRDADTEVSPTSHEIMEAITDPDTETGWYDSSGFENGDECAYVFGTTHGTAGHMYNQVINGHQYLTQEEFSNHDFFRTGGGCLQGE